MTSEQHACIRELINHIDEAERVRGGEIPDMCKALPGAPETPNAVFTDVRLLKRLRRAFDGR